MRCEKSVSQGTRDVAGGSKKSEQNGDPGENFWKVLGSGGLGGRFSNGARIIEFE